MPRSDDQLHKTELMKFHEQSLEGAQKETERIANVREKHQKAEEDAKVHAASVVQQQVKQAEKQKALKRKWQMGKREQKEEIVSDKKRRSDEVRHIEERKEKEQKFEEAQRKFFESFREQAARKALKARGLYEKEQEYKAAMVQAEVVNRQKKGKIDAEFLRAKSLLDRKELEGKREIEATARKEKDTIFAEGQRKKQELLPLKQQNETLWRSRAQETENLYVKKRAELDAAERTKVEFHRQMMQKELRELEKKTLVEKNKADSDYRDQKMDYQRRIEKLKYEGVPEEGV